MSLQVCRNVGEIHSEHTTMSSMTAIDSLLLVQERLDDGDAKVGTQSFRNVENREESRFL